MDCYDTRMRVERTLEFVMAAPVNWAEVGKVMNVIRERLDKLGIAYSDDAAWFVPGDDAVIIKVPVKVEYTAAPVAES